MRAAEHPEQGGKAGEPVEPLAALTATFWDELSLTEQRVQVRRFDLYVNQLIGRPHPAPAGRPSMSELRGDTIKLGDR